MVTKKLSTSVDEQLQNFCDLTAKMYFDNRTESGHSVRYGVIQLNQY